MEIYKYHRLDNPPFPAGFMGIEIEAEGRHLLAPNMLPKNWKATKDGSLRGEAYEYLLAKPLSVTDLKASLVDFVKSSVENGVEYKFSNRTSVHVHLNAYTMSIAEIANLLCMYYMFEEVLLNFCGDSRIDNRFCLSFKNAFYIQDIIEKYLSFTDIWHLNENLGKYSALNLAAIQSHGSIEFRAMRGTVDIDVLFPWIDVIQNLYKLSSEFNNPLAILNTPLDQLAETIFGEHSKKFLTNGWKDKVQYTLSIGAHLFNILQKKYTADIERDKKVPAKEDRIKKAKKAVDMNALAAAPQLVIDAPGLANWHPDVRFGENGAFVMRVPDDFAINFGNVVNQVPGGM